MGSFKGYDRQEGPKRRRGEKSPRRQGYPDLEILEPRRLLSGGTAQLDHCSRAALDADGHQSVQCSEWADGQPGCRRRSTSTSRTSPTAATRPARSRSSRACEFQNGMVGIELKSLGGDFSQFLTQVSDAGVQVTATDRALRHGRGFRTHQRAADLAELSQTEAGQAQITPIAYGCCGSEYQGEAYNEAETSMFADVARTEFNVDGTGVTVGVLSTASINTTVACPSRTAPATSTRPIPSTCSRTGRPAATTKAARCWRTSTTSLPAPTWHSRRAPSARSLSARISRPLPDGRIADHVDDIGYADEPMFQDGVIAQAIDPVTADGVTYFSAAGNEGPDSGYLSQFRGDHRRPSPESARHVHEFQSQRRHQRPSSRSRRASRTPRSPSSTTSRTSSRSPAARPGS